MCSLLTMATAPGTQSLWQALSRAMPYHKRSRGQSGHSARVRNRARILQAWMYDRHSELHLCNVTLPALQLCTSKQHSKYLQEIFDLAWQASQRKEQQNTLFHDGHISCNETTQPYNSATDAVTLHCPNQPNFTCTSFLCSTESTPDNIRRMDIPANKLTSMSKISIGRP